MSATREVEKAIGQYLETVAAQLGGSAPDEKDNILRDIESHIYAELEKAGNGPSLEDLEVILAGMDPPASWAASAAVVPREARCQAFFSRCLLLAGAAAPFGVGLLIAWFVVFGGRMPARGTLPAWIQLLFVLGFLSPVTTTVLGLMSVSAIRASRGRLMGMPLAVFTALLYPLLALFAVVGYFPAYGLGHLEGWDNVAVVGGVLAFLIAAAIDVVIFVRVLRWATRPLAAGEPA